MKSAKLFSIVFFVLLLSVSAPLAQDKTDQVAMSAPSVAYQAAFPITIQAGEYDLVTVIFDFAPGSGFPTHFHGGHALAVVLSGEITLREKGSEKLLKAGGNLTETPGAIHSAVNTGTTTARVAVSMLVPKGAEPTTIIGK
jgi:quercetin dioxygenase-like cupin family protein